MHCSNLAYATSDSPTGPFTFRGNIIDSGDNYPGGNNHGSICCIKGQWYIFYHRMTNDSIFSRRGCVEKIEILEDGTIPQVEATSLGFEDSLNPYKQTPADIACVLTNGAYIIEHNETCDIQVVCDLAERQMPLEACDSHLIIHGHFLSILTILTEKFYHNVQ